MGLFAEKLALLENERVKALEKATRSINEQISTNAKKVASLEQDKINGIEATIKELNE